MLTLLDLQNGLEVMDLRAERGDLLLGRGGGELGNGDLSSRACMKIPSMRAVCLFGEGLVLTAGLGELCL